MPINTKFVFIKEHVKIKPGAVIGYEGYSYKRFNNGKLIYQEHRYPVIIHKNVSIGAGVVIDRGSWRPTIIGEGTKINNLSMIGHNVQIGKHCEINSGVHIHGSTTIEDFAEVKAGARILQHATIGEKAIVGANSLVLKNTTIPSNEVWFGSPATFKRMRREDE